MWWANYTCTQSHECEYTHVKHNNIYSPSSPSYSFPICWFLKILTTDRTVVHEYTHRTQQSSADISVLVTNLVSHVNYIHYTHTSYFSSLGSAMQYIRLLCNRLVSALNVSHTHLSAVARTSDKHTHTHKQTKFYYLRLILLRTSCVCRRALHALPPHKRNI